MMTTPLDNFYLQQPEPLKGCLLALREIIILQHNNIVQTWKYGMPFFCHNKKMFCYLWVHKKYKQPYIGIVEGKHFTNPELIIEKRSRMKIMLFDPEQDLPINKIVEILKQAIERCR